MAFYKDISEKLKTELNTLLSSFTISVYGGTGAHIEGHKGLGYMAPDEIVFKSKRGNLTIKGKELRISEISKTDAYVVGVITSVTMGVQDE